MKEDIKDIKFPIDIPSPWTWVWITLVIVVVAAIVVWLIALFLRRPQKKERSLELPQISPWEKAYSALENLRLRNLTERLDLKPYYSELSNIIRHYIEERFSIKAPEMTTEEFLDSLRFSAVLNDEQKKTLKEFLYTCDMVKFAKLQPTASEAKHSFDLVKLLIDQTHGN